MSLMCRKLVVEDFIAVERASEVAWPDEQMTRLIAAQPQLPFSLRHPIRSNLGFVMGAMCFCPLAFVSVPWDFAARSLPEVVWLLLA